MAIVTSLGGPASHGFAPATASAVNATRKPARTVHFGHSSC
jgi:hypothetical protein